ARARHRGRLTPRSRSRWRPTVGRGTWIREGTSDAAIDTDPGSRGPPGRGLRARVRGTEPAVRGGPRDQLRARRVRDDRDVPHVLAVGRAGRRPVPLDAD